MRPPIALDHRPALLSRAGIGRVTRELARALAARDDVDLHLFGHSLAPARVPFATPANARLHRLPIPGRSLPWLARIGISAERLAGNSPVFHWTDFIQPPVGNAKTVLTVHDLAFVRDPSWHGDAATTLRERTANAIARADVVVVPSRTTAADVREFAPTADVRHIPFGVDHVPPAPPSSSFSRSDYAICIGTIEPRKNHRTLLAAWRLLPEPRPHLLVIGGVGWECDAVVRELEAAERDGIATWWRDCDDDRAFAALHHASLCVYPSLWEGFGLPPLEAMHCGVPVVAHDTPAVVEHCRDAAVITDATKPATLASAIHRALTDREPLRRAGRERVRDLTWQRCAAAHAELYRELAATGAAQ
ncbi:MAG: glycosyltransferase family 4 protein [bacterium]|nr:glycosyltransferase family 4 protein [bacterium]